MPKRRADADTRRFFDEFEKVRVSRFRATGVIDPAKRTALIPFPNSSRVKLIDTAHTQLKHGGGYSYFACPKCGKLAGALYLIDDAPRCGKCCNALNIWERSKYGFGLDARRQASDQHLDRLIAKLETSEPLRLKTPASWHGKAKLVYRSHRLTDGMRRRMITLRLNQLASQQANNGGLKLTRSFKPSAQALAVIPELAQVWRARSTERLEQALDKAQTSIFKALESNDPRLRLTAASLMLKTKQARERGFTGLNR